MGIGEWLGIIGFVTGLFSFIWKTATRVTVIEGKIDSLEKETVENKGDIKTVKGMLEIIIELKSSMQRIEDNMNIKFEHLEEKIRDLKNK